jgi:hypothetical protein
MPRSDIYLVYVDLFPEAGSLEHGREISEPYTVKNILTCYATISLSTTLLFGIRVYCYYYV